LVGRMLALSVADESDVDAVAGVVAVGTTTVTDPVVPFDVVKELLMLNF